ncbi:uncharacterized protein [Dermacentor andersoni]|uniref:uncharacterized protein isoform X6 n=1 Tax=Dermacentor andersoni TaxID=34620 RepID=UPI002416CE7B|nr:uncharacterized protein LOC129384594 isoform X6 [Dermacentor andersoni]
MIRDSVPLVPQDGWKWLAVAVILATYGYTQKSVQKCDFDEQERKQLTYCAKKHFDSVISAIEMKVFLNFTTNMRNRDLKVLRNGIKKDKTMLQFSDCFTHLYE